jgi:hypothetical protein
MKRIALSLFAVAFLTTPALAGSPVVTDKPMVVAEGAEIDVGAVRLGVGDRDRHRDGDLRRNRRDGDRDVVVIKPKHRDRDRDRDREHGERAHD